MSKTRFLLIALGLAVFHSSICSATSYTKNYGLSSPETANAEQADADVTAITLSRTELVLGISYSYALTATVTPTDATDQSLAWSSSDEAVATVSDAGVVTAVAEGSATITAAANDGSGVTATCAVTVQEAYPIASALEDANINRSSYGNDRYLNSLTFTTSAGTQTITVNQTGTGKVYQDLTSSSIIAKSGDEITTSVSAAMNAMHGFLYIDYDNDGQFSPYTVNSDGTPTTDSELVSYSGYKINSLGATLSGNSWVPPVFTLRSGLAPGNYRARYKIDWESLDPAGQSSMITNGGVLVDFIITVPAFSLTADETWFTTEDVASGFTLPLTCDETVTNVNADGITLKKTTYNSATPTTEDITGTFGLTFSESTVSITFGEALAEGTYKVTLPAGAVTANGTSNDDASEFEFTVANVVPTTLDATSSTGFASDTKWYVFKYAKVSNTSQYTLSAGSDGTVSLSTSSPDVSSDAQLWCFVGSQADGYTIYNKSLGANYVLASSTTMSGTNGGGTVASMMLSSNVTDGYTSTWGIVSTTHSSVPIPSDHGSTQHLISGYKGYYIYQFGSPTYKLNNRSTDLSFWSGETHYDDGSTFNFEDCELLDATVTVEASPSVSKHYRFTRTFKEGWNTLYLPFATTKTALGADDVQVYNADNSATSNTLSFVEYGEEDITAFTPLLVKFGTETSKVLTYSGTVDDFDATTGANAIGNWTFKGNLESGFSMSGLYGVVTSGSEQVIKKGSASATLGSMLCYFEGTTANAAPISISFGGGEVTSIDGVEINSGANAPVYNLQGIRMGNSVESLPAGLYIVGGKKVLVK